MIPKKIFTICFGEISPLIAKCINSQKIPGYEHRLITLDNYYKGSRYVNEALAAEHWGIKRFCKASDWLRLYYVFSEGGIYLDADMEVLPGKNFDDLLDNKIFVGMDENGYHASSVMGAEVNHPLLGYIISEVENNFRGDGGWIWEPGMEYFSKIVAARKNEFGVKVLTPDYFFPFHWKDNTVNFTENTRAYHHYLGSWNYI